MNERIKAIREALGLSRRKFGEKFYVSQDVINNLERGRVTPTKEYINGICQQYNVNEHWLRTGEGEMFQPQPASLDSIAQANQIDALTRAVVETLIEMPQVQRDAFLQLVKNVAERVRRAEADDAQPLQIDQDVKAIIRDAKAKGALEGLDAQGVQTK